MDNIGVLLTNPYIVFGALFIVVFVLFFIFGMCKGKRRASYRWITTLIYFGLLFIFGNTIVNFVTGYDLTPYALSIDVNGTSYAVTSVKGTIDAVLEGYVGGASAQVADLVVQFSGILIKLMLYTVLGLILGIPYRIVTWLIYIALFRRKKTETNAKGKPCKPKKKPLTGGLLNAFRGVAVAALFVVLLVNAPMSILPDDVKLSDLITVKEAEGGLEDTALEVEEDNDLLVVVSFIDGYKASVFYKAGQIGSNIGDKGADISINSLVNGMVWTVKVDGEKVNVLKDLQKIGDVLPAVVDVVSSAQAEDGTFNLAAVNFDKVGEIMTAISETNLIPAILPTVVEVACESESVKAFLEEQGIDPNSIKQIDVGGDFTKLARLGALVSEFMASVSYVENEENLQSLEYMDFSKLDWAKLHEITNLLGDMDVLNQGMGLIAGAVGNQADVQAILAKVTEVLGEFKLDKLLGDFVDVLEKIVATGISSVHYIQNNYIEYFNGLGFGANEFEHGSVGEVVQTLMASYVVQQFFPVIFEQYVLPSFPEQLRPFVDTSLLEDPATLTAEIEALLEFVRDAKGEENLPIIDSEGNFNYELLNNLSADGLLKSRIFCESVYNFLKATSEEKEEYLGEKAGEVTSESGKGLLDYILVPDSLKNASVDTWMVKEIWAYKLNQDLTIEGVEYAMYSNVSPELYNAYTAENKESLFTPLYKVVGGEIYNLVSGVFEVYEAVDFTRFARESKENNVDLNGLISRLVQDVDGHTPFYTLLQSDIVRLSITYLFSDNFSEYIVIPASSADTYVCDGVSYQAIKADEFDYIISLVRDVDFFYDTYTVASYEFGEYEIGTHISKEVYDSLSDEDKLNVSHNVEAKDDLRIIYEIDVDNVDITKSHVLTATITKVLVDNEEIVVPSGALTTIDGVSILTDAELNALVKGLQGLEFIDDEGKLRDIETVKAEISGDTAKEALVSASLILSETLK